MLWSEYLVIFARPPPQKKRPSNTQHRFLLIGKLVCSNVLCEVWQRPTNMNFVIQLSFAWQKLAEILMESMRANKFRDIAEIVASQGGIRTSNFWTLFLPTKNHPLHDPASFESRWSQKILHFLKGLDVTLRAKPLTSGHINKSSPFF